MLAVLALASVVRPAGASIADTVHPDFELKEIRMPALFKTMGLAFLQDGTMVLATTEAIGSGEVPAPDPEHCVYLVRGASTDTMPLSMVDVADNWKQLAGVTVANDQVYVSDRDGFYKIANLADPGDPKANRNLIVKWPDESHWNNGPFWHQWAFTPLYWKGEFYAPFSGSIRAGGWSNVDATSSLSGAFLTWNVQGNLHAYAGGLRSPNGANVDPETGEMFVTDNQGSWEPASTFLRIRKDHFYGHRQSSPDLDTGGHVVGTHAANFAEALPYDPPVAWLPHNLVRSSPSQPVRVPKGMYAGDWLIGDVNSPGLVRVSLDRVGDAVNGAVFWFSKGTGGAAINRMAYDKQGGLVIGTLTRIGGNWPAGDKAPLFRLSPKATASVFDLKAVRSVSDGLELEFTQPLSADSLKLEGFSVRQWQYVRMQEYGLGKQPEMQAPILSAEASRDRKTLHLRIPGLHEDRVVYLQVTGLKSLGGASLWNDEAWFTLNAMSNRVWSPTTGLEGETGHPRPDGPRIPDPVTALRVAGQGILEVTLDGQGPCELGLSDLDGASVRRVSGASGTVRIARPGSLSGIYLLTAKRGGRTSFRRVFF
jgi:hypothetical protein